MLNLAIVHNDGAVEALSLSRARPRHVHIEFIPGESAGEGIASLALSSAYGPLGKKDVFFVPACAPENAFYLRWINENGGYDYRMFEERFVDARTASDNVDFMPYQQINEAAAEGERSRVSTEASRTVSIVATALSAAALKSVQGILTSPKIEWYSADRKVFIEVTLDGDLAIEKDSSLVQWDAALSLRLPGINTQF